MTWQEDNRWESDWWGNCVNTTREELLQMSYASRIGLETFHDGRSPYNVDLAGRSILDIGGGPVSLLLKCRNGGVMTVVDPCRYPAWIAFRYAAAGINYEQMPAECFEVCDLAPYSEAWIYNVLQHTMDPEHIIENAKKSAKTIRLFEFVDTGTSPGHPHELTEEKLNDWLGIKGTRERFQEHGADGYCYYGVWNDSDRTI